ncbi:hypothetical protein I0C86_03115 [Plantactinospora sp. S1510]|uniref:Uncharacterized protein n=1 Tax=Plantactinospora alkalitolerans TaxID=2789879 RepID=A0ABS0GP67_9ACTN|nr:hypothetical protein [Plantactinospora alkalitolerans]
MDIRSRLRQVVDAYGSVKHASVAAAEAAAAHCWTATAPKSVVLTLAGDRLRGMTLFLHDI